MRLLNEKPYGKLLCFFNMASSYRYSIYSKMEIEFDCDFIFGPPNNGIITIDYSKLKNFKKVVERRNLLNKNFWYEKEVVSVLRKRIYSTFIITGEPYSLTTWRLLFLSRFYRTKIILWTHGYYGKETTIEKILKKMMYGLSSHVFLYGIYAKQLMLKNNIAPESKLSVIYNSLDYDTHILERNKLKPDFIYEGYFGNNFRNLIFVGRLTHKKKLELILYGLTVIRDKGFQFNLILIGEGEAQNNLEALADQLNLKQNIWFYGATFNESVLAEMIYNADLCVSPGNVGLTAIHSMSFGTPVITHNDFSMQMPEFESIIPGVTGDFFEKDNVQSLATTITNWFEKAPDRNLIRQNCYKVIDEKYNPYVQIKTMKTIFCENK